jgi:hypothetical protein
MRQVEHLLCRSLLDELTGFQNGDPGGSRCCVEVVGNQDQGQFGSVAQQAGERVQDAASGDRVEAAWGSYAILRIYLPTKGVS